MLVFAVPVAPIRVLRGVMETVSHSQGTVVLADDKILTPVSSLLTLRIEQGS